MTLRWGILATGHIGKTFARAVDESEHNTLVAVGSRTLASAEKFASQFAHIELTQHGCYEDLISDQNVDAIYVSTPHSDHAAWTIRALQAGKSVLCEKPIGLNHAEVMAMVEEARRNHCFLMEAFMYRLHPQTLEIQKLIAQGAIGEVRHIEAKFGYQTPFNADSRLFANHLAGGGIMDVGCYPISFARTMMQSEPTAISGHGHLGKTGVDEWASALLKFDGGRSAQISASVSLQLGHDATVYGSEGQIYIPNPWLPADAEGHWSFELRQADTTKTVSGTAPPLWVIEADHVAQAIGDGANESSVVTWQDSLNNALALDQWRASIGLAFEKETPAKHSGPLLGILHPSGDGIPKARVGHLEKDVSRLVMGCDNQPSMSHASIMWDDFFEAGGNCFDTAHIYGDGAMESLLGHWHSQRGIRDDIVIIGKGAHTPTNFPAHISPELDISLDRLQTDHVDIYFLHRDNLDIPVAEFIDALNKEVSAGRICAFGGSNWSLARVREANEYAAANNLQGFSAISNNFSLAHMNMPIWPGTESSSGTPWIDYLKESQLALMPWSSQARGFFTPWADQVIADQGKENIVVTSVQPTIAELKRVWFSAENFERRERAAELATKYNVSMINIALAYVLRQQFPTFPLIGPRVLSETASCIDSLSIELTAEEVLYLNLDDR